MKDVFGGKKRKSAEKLAQPKKKKEAALDLPADQAAAARLELLVGSVLSSEPVEDSDTLWKGAVDVGEGEPRTIGAALRQAYPDGLAGKKVIVLANTKPRNLAGFKSQGMLVCATLDDTTKLIEVDAAPGTPAIAAREASAMDRAWIAHFFHSNNIVRAFVVQISTPASIDKITALTSSLEIACSLRKGAAK